MIGVALLVTGVFCDLGQNLTLPLLVQNGQIVFDFIPDHVL